MIRVLLLAVQVVVIDLLEGSAMDVRTGWLKPGDLKMPKFGVVMEQDKARGFSPEPSRQLSQPIGFTAPTKHNVWREPGFGSRKSIDYGRLGVCRPHKKQAFFGKWRYRDCQGLHVSAARTHFPTLPTLTLKTAFLPTKNTAGIGAQVINVRDCSECLC